MTAVPVNPETARERLRGMAERESFLKRQGASYTGTVPVDADELLALLAELAGLRTALERIASGAESNPPSEVAAVARRALAVSVTPPEGPS